MRKIHFLFLLSLKGGFIFSDTLIPIVMCQIGALDGIDAYHYTDVGSVQISSLVTHAHFCILFIDFICDCYIDKTFKIKSLKKKAGPSTLCDPHVSK